MRRRMLITAALMLTLFASSMGMVSMGRAKAAGPVRDNADWNKAKVN